MTPAGWLTPTRGLHSLGRHNKTHMSQGFESSFHRAGGYYLSICAIGFRVMEMFFMSKLHPALKLFGWHFIRCKQKDERLINILLETEYNMLL